MWLLPFLASLLGSSPNATWTTSAGDNNNDGGVSRQSSQPQSPDRSFWDLQSFQADERKKLLRTALDITDLEGYIDWDLLHDNYVNAVLLDVTSGQNLVSTTALDETGTIEKKDAILRRRLVDEQQDEDNWDDGEEGGILDEDEEEDSEEDDKEEGDRELSHHRMRGPKRHKRNRHKKRKKINLKRKRSSEQDKALTAAGPTTTATPPVTTATPPVTTTTTSSYFGNGGGSILIPVYTFSTGKCPNAGTSPLAVPCAPSNLKDICDKYSSQGSFKACLTACEPSFCCIHNAPDATNTYAPNCNTDVNCAQWAYCYIAWWKLADHIGPATRLRVEQHDPFYDVKAADITALLQSNLVFYKQFLFHFFKDSAKIIQLGTVQVNKTLSNFDIDRIILNSTYWNTTL